MAKLSERQERLRRRMIPELRSIYYRQIYHQRRLRDLQIERYLLRFEPRTIWPKILDAAKFICP